jgi:hypothetical protein
MRQISLSITLFLLTITIATCQSPHNIQKIEFSTMTRGYQKQVFITPDSVIEIIDGRSDEHRLVKKKLAPDTWSKLAKQIEIIQPSKMPELVSPSARRTHDAARHSSLKLIDHTGKEWAHNFDDENPHPQLKPLMDAIIEITGESQ